MVREEDEVAGLFPTEPAPEPYDIISKLNSKGVLEPPPEFGHDREDTTAVAVNPTEEAANPEANDVYLANLTSVEGEDRTTVAAFTPAGEPIQRFSTKGLKDGDGIAVDSKTGAVYVADAKSDEVDVFQLEPAGPPSVSELSACTLAEEGSGCPSAPETTTLKAQVDPHGADTEYRFEYGPESCAASACTMTKEKQIAAAFKDEGVSVELAGLPAGLHHYRVFAKNGFGTVRSEERTFTILSSAKALPDGREWEMVSPPKKDGAEPEVMTTAGGDEQASEDGQAITYVSDGPFGSEPEGSRNPEFAQELSTRGATAWSTQDITPPNNIALGLSVGQLGSEEQLFSPDLALAVVDPFPGAESSGSLAQPPLSPRLPGEIGPQEKTVYLRANGPEELLRPEASEAENYGKAKKDGEEMTPTNAGYLALVSELNAPGGEPFGDGIISAFDNQPGINFSGAATPDLRHVVFYSHRAAPGIYEWGPPGSCSNTETFTLCTGGDVQPVDLLPSVMGTVTAKSKSITSIALGESSLSPGVEIAGEGIPFPTTIVKQIKAGEWEMSAEATGTHSGEAITVYAKSPVDLGGGEGQGTEGHVVRNAISNDGTLVFWKAVNGPAPLRA